MTAPVQSRAEKMFFPVLAAVLTVCLGPLVIGAWASFGPAAGGLMALIILAFSITAATWGLPRR